MENNREEKGRLDTKVTEAQEKERSARKQNKENPSDAALRDAAIEAKRSLRNISRVRKQTIKEWENSWWADMGTRTSEAHHRGDQAELYKLMDEMQMREHVGRKDTGRTTVANVETERDAWKKHFQKVSEGRGKVDSKVWRVIGHGKKKAEWLGNTPCDREMDKCVAKMKTSKAAGQDGFVTELLKYGGSASRG